MTKSTQGLLVICRHTESEWSAIGKIAGKVDISLSDEGLAHAKRISNTLRDIAFDVMYTSEQQRAKQTKQVIFEQHPYKKPPLWFIHASLNERDFGELTGLKVDSPTFDSADYDQVQNEWDTPAPGGESLRQVSERVISFYTAEILPRLKAGMKVLVVTHGTPTRVLLKHLQGVRNEDIGDIRVALGDVYYFDINPDGSVVKHSTDHS